ncbi:MAG: hypothetical protein HOO96_11700 [Polyangiaceae bacterium]|nr:hypothetical protein [Polyangiaceae bacterium]
MTTTRVLARIDDGTIDAIRTEGSNVVFTQKIGAGKNKVLVLRDGKVTQVADKRGDFDSTLAVLNGTAIWKEIQQDKDGLVELFSASLSGTGGVARRASMESLLFTADREQVYFGDGGRLFAMGPVGPPRLLAKDKDAADIERGLMLTSARDRLFFWVVASKEKTFRTETKKRAVGRVVSVAKAGGELRDEIVVAEGIHVVAIAANERTLFWVESGSGEDAPQRLRARPIEGGDAREVATLAPTISFLDLEARGEELVWESLGLGLGGRSSAMRLTPKRQEVLFEGTNAVKVAPDGVLVARSTGEYGKGAELLLVAVPPASP